MVFDGYTRMRKFRTRGRMAPRGADLIERAAIAEERVRNLRENATYSELNVLSLLDKLKYKYIFQYALFDEWYFLIADFYLPNARLMIEVDGQSHFNTESRKKEAKRKKWLKMQGIEVLRIKNEATNKLTPKQLNTRIKKVLAKKKK